MDKVIIDMADGPAQRAEELKKAAAEITRRFHEPLVLEFRKCKEPPDIPCGPRERTYVPALPGKHRRRR